METKQVQHTPGPWKVGVSHEGSFGIVADGEDAPCIAWVGSEDRLRWLSARAAVIDPEAELSQVADARLIAAAPALLEALERFVRWHSSEPCPSGTVEDRIREAQSALAAARGEEASRG